MDLLDHLLFSSPFDQLGTLHDDLPSPIISRPTMVHSLDCLSRYVGIEH